MTSFTMYLGKCDHIQLEDDNGAGYESYKFFLDGENKKSEHLYLHTEEKKTRKLNRPEFFFRRTRMKKFLKLSRISFFSAVNMVQGPSPGLPTEQFIQTVKGQNNFWYTQSPLIRTTAKLPTLGVLKNSSNLDAHRFLILQV